MTIESAARMFGVDVYNDQELSELIDILWYFDAPVLEIQCWKSASKAQWN
jgi:hypothetical protein